VERTKVEELQRSWKAPAGLLRSRPREVQATRAGVIVRGLGMFIMVVAPAVCLYWASAILSQNKVKTELAASNEVVTGEVVRLWETKDESRQPWVEYSFHGGNRIITGRAKAPRKIWRTLQVGSPIPIRIVSGNPKRNHPAEWEPSQFPVAIVGVIALLNMAIGGFLQYRVSLQRKLLEDGRPAPGILTKFGGGQKKQIAYYEYVTLNGTVQAGRSQRGAGLPPVGGTLCVVYDPDNPKRSSPYPMAFFKLKTN